MAKVHLLLKKEEICEEKMSQGNKVAVVLDVLLATTTITSALWDGAKEVIPVKDLEEAMFFASNYENSILAGELDAKPVEGFVYPSPRILRERVPGKTLILSTTNGTVALKKAATSKRVYIASLLNNQAVAGRIQTDLKDQTIIVICSGNSGEISLEDFYGAGHFISCLVFGHESEVELTDAAKSAFYFYSGHKGDSLNILQDSYVGKLFEKHSFSDELQFAATKGLYPIVPVLDGEKIIVEKSYKTT